MSSQPLCHPYPVPGDSLSLETFPPSELATQYTNYTDRPLVLLPKALTDVDPTWSCIMGDTGLGMLDLPRALQHASALASTAAMTTPKPEADFVTTATAEPAPTISSDPPRKTSVVMTLPKGVRIVDYPPLEQVYFPITRRT